MLKHHAIKSFGRLIFYVDVFKCFFHVCAHREFLLAGMIPLLLRYIVYVISSLEYLFTRVHYTSDDF